MYDGQVVKSDYKGDGSVEVYTSGIIGSSDYFVPKYFVDANPDFRDWRDLNKYKDQFATPETGSKGRLIGCAVAGWNCHDQKRLDLLGIDFEAVELGTEVAALAEAQAAYSRQEPFLLYFWTPHWFQGAYEMVGVKLPEWKACDKFTEANNWEDCGTGSWPATGWDKDYTINYMNPAVFAKPEMANAKAFFQKMKLSNDDQAVMINEIDKNGRDIVEVVQEWKDNNKDSWSKWLP
jgi:glycine betaine/proline transport system substrate-binding protein